MWKGDGSVVQKRRRHTGTGAIIGIIVLVLGGLAQPVSVTAFTYPGYVASWYMDTVNTTTVYNMGCALGTARQGGSAPQDALVIMAYGQPQLRGGVYGSFDFANTYVTVTQIKNAVVEYAHGFFFCTGSNGTAHVRIAVGTSNFANFSKNAGMTDAEVTGHAKAWANMVNAINSDIISFGYQSQADAVGAADIEVSWGTSTTGRRWVDGYESVNSWAFYDFGDAAGCRQSGTTATSGQCGTSSWFQDDLYYVSWGLSSAWGVPEIYREDAAQAKQWQQISNWGTLNGKSKIQFIGSLTQHGACGTGCSGTNNTAQAGWTQLRDRCAADAATALSTLKFAADIDWR